MALPKLGERGDIVVQVEWDPVGAAGVYSNWCGATNFGFNLSNEIQSTNVGDCDDWGLPIVVNKSYGPQNITASMDATWAAATHVRTQDWAFDQKSLKVRILFPTAAVGQVARYDGVALVSGLDLNGIGNVDGQPQTETVNLEFSGAILRTLAT